MSFKWKWLLTTFMAQVLLGGIFTGIQYVHMSRYAQTEIVRMEQALQAELVRAFPKGGAEVPAQLNSLIRDLYTRYAAQAVWAHHGGETVASLGRPLEQTSRLHPALNLEMPLPGSAVVLALQLDPDHVYRARDDMVFYLAGVFLLSAVACALILMGLSNTLLARLEDLRVKAAALQAGHVDSRIVVRGRDEISCLGSTFNNMAQAIENQMKVMELNHARSLSEKNRLDLLLSALSSGVAYLDQHFNLLYANRALANMLRFNLPLQEPLKLETLLLQAGVVPEHRLLLRDMVTDYFSKHEVPVELAFRDGKVLQFRFAVYSDEVQGAHAVLIADDVSIRKNVEDLRNEVERDPLTGVLNRRGFELTLNTKIARLLPGEALGLVFLDLDGFKAVNDTLGHKAGDQILKTSATLLKGATRNVDQVARLGGDEFAIIVSRCNQQLLTNIAERIIEAFACDKLLLRIRQNHGLRVSCSIGAAMYPLHGHSVTELLELSDAQMYEAKKAGKNCYRIANTPGAIAQAVKI
ncbi:diguanylate cyclase domain-containing protein [Limnobacter sp.]|uniref:GGDEF domain-containing protein n=1 Tax=Limnobacter sp. TaxID=2003368 RepID=UPI003518F446